MKHELLALFFVGLICLIGLGELAFWFFVFV